MESRKAFCASSRRVRRVRLFQKPVGMVIEDKDPQNGCRKPDASLDAVVPPTE